jgi:hypothetical protein
LAFKRAKILTISSSESEYTEILKIIEEINFMSYLLNDIGLQVALSDI